MKPSANGPSCPPRGGIRGGHYLSGAVSFTRHGSGAFRTEPAHSPARTPPSVSLQICQMAILNWENRGKWPLAFKRQGALPWSCHNSTPSEGACACPRTDTDNVHAATAAMKGAGSHRPKRSGISVMRKRSTGSGAPGRCVRRADRPRLTSGLAQLAGLPLASSSGY